MHVVIHRSIVTLYLCWNLINATPTLSPNIISLIPLITSGPHDGNDFFKHGNIQSSVAKPNITTKPSQIGYGRMTVSNKVGKKVDFQIKTKLNARKSTDEFDMANQNMNFFSNVTLDIEMFYYNVYYTLKEHLFQCLQMDNSEKSYKVYQIVNFISIKQNLLNNSIALLLQNELDIKQLMRLYFFFCGSFQAPDRSENGIKYYEYSPRIRDIQKEINEKFKDIIGNEHPSKNLHGNQLQKLKKNTERKLSNLATIAIYKYKPKGPLLPCTPLHFVCIDLLKWTALMGSDNDDAVKIQQMKIKVENRDITMRRYVERYKYEINIVNLEPLNFEVLLRINTMLLCYLYKHFELSIRLINTNISKIKPNTKDAISLAIVQTGSLREFLEILDQFFVTRYLYYVVQTTAQAKITALISYMDRFSANVEDTVRELELSPEKTVNDIDKLINEFTTALLLDLKVDDPQKWIDGVNEEVAGMSDNISAAIELNKQNALAIIAVCFKQLNPDWPNISYRDQKECLAATLPRHKIRFTEEYDD